MSKVKLTLLFLALSGLMAALLYGCASFNPEGSTWYFLEEDYSSKEQRIETLVFYEKTAVLSTGDSYEYTVEDDDVVFHYGPMRLVLSRIQQDGMWILTDHDRYTYYEKTDGPQKILDEAAAAAQVDLEKATAEVRSILQGEWVDKDGWSDSEDLAVFNADTLSLDYTIHNIFRDGKFTPETTSVKGAYQVKLYNAQELKDTNQSSRIGSNKPDGVTFIGLITVDSPAAKNISFELNKISNGTLDLKLKPEGVLVEPEGLQRQFIYTKKK
jgi:hypothetical protein